MEENCLNCTAPVMIHGTLCLKCDREQTLQDFFKKFRKVDSLGYHMVNSLKEEDIEDIQNILDYIKSSYVVLEETKHTIVFTWDHESQSKYIVIF